MSKHRWVVGALMAVVVSGAFVPAAEAAVPANSVLPKITGTA
jgi:hypothetical protein